MSGFGECEGCGNSVERVGWDRLCFSCQDEEREEWESRLEAMAEEDHRLYTIPLNPGPGSVTPGKPRAGRMTVLRVSGRGCVSLCARGACSGG